MAPKDILRTPLGFGTAPLVLAQQVAEKVRMFDNACASGRPEWQRAYSADEAPMVFSRERR